MLFLNYFLNKKPLPEKLLKKAVFLQQTSKLQRVMRMIMLCRIAAFANVACATICKAAAYTAPGVLARA